MKISELMIILNNMCLEHGDKELIFSEKDRICFEIGLYYDNNYDKVVIEGESSD